MSQYWKQTEVQVEVKSPWNSVCLDEISTTGCKCGDRDDPKCRAVRYLQYDHFFTPKFRKLMWAGILPNLKRVASQLQFDPSKFRVALHVRRGDVTRKHGHSSRYLPQDYYHKIVKTIRAHLDADVHLFSQGNPADFGEMAALGVKLHLNTATDIAWAHMIEAQLFVMVRCRGRNCVACTVATHGCFLFVLPSCAVSIRVRPPAHSPPSLPSTITESLSTRKITARGPMSSHWATG